MARERGGVPLRDYIDQRCQLLQEEIDRRDEQRRREIDQRLTGTERAIDKAESEMNRRLESMNEFRDAMRDQAARMMTRDAFDLAAASEKDRAEAIHTAQAARIDKLESADGLAGRIDKLESVVDRQRGKQAAYALIAAVVGALVPIIIIVIGHIR